MLFRSGQQILYETKLAKVGSMLTWGALLAMLLFCGFGLTLSFLVDFPGNLFPATWAVLCAVLFGFQLRRVLPLRSNPGGYRISVDDYGLYVQSDAPSVQPSFSVAATDLHRLIRKTIQHSDTADDHEYYVETKSGKRHRIEDILLVDSNLNVMDLFQAVTKRFHWVEITEEIQP